MLTTVIAPHTPVAHGGNPQTLDDSLPLRYRTASRREDRAGSP
ncbi:hypothetical protein [Nostoc sp.]